MCIFYCLHNFEVLCVSFYRDRIILVSKTSRYPVPIVSMRNLMSGRYNRIYRPLLASPHLRYFGNPNRTYAMFIGRILRGALKVRYLLLGGAVGGGVTLQKVTNIQSFSMYIIFIYVLLSLEEI